MGNLVASARGCGNGRAEPDRLATVYRPAERGVNPSEPSHFTLFVTTYHDARVCPPDGRGAPGWYVQCTAGMDMRSGIELDPSNCSARLRRWLFQLYQARRGRLTAAVDDHWRLEGATSAAFRFIAHEDDVEPLELALGAVERLVWGRLPKQQVRSQLRFTSPTATCGRSAAASTSPHCPPGSLRARCSAAATLSLLRVRLVAVEPHADQLSHMDQLDQAMLDAAIEARRGGSPRRWVLPAHEQHTGRALHVVPSSAETVRLGVFDANLPNVLEIDSGDVVVYPNTWSHFLNRLQPGVALTTCAFAAGEPGKGPHSIVGPVGVRGAEPGDMLAIHFQRLIPVDWGATFVNPGDLGTGTLPEEFPTARRAT